MGTVTSMTEQRAPFENVEEAAAAIRRALWNDRVPCRIAATEMQDNIGIRIFLEILKPDSEDLCQDHITINVVSRGRKICADTEHRVHRSQNIFDVRNSAFNITSGVDELISAISNAISDTQNRAIHPIIESAIAAAESLTATAPASPFRRMCDWIVSTVAAAAEHAILPP